ncbi:hypothetical protein LTR37_000271 [Vermiconidia calcicola]|uniref:Uncharacterized protein n=1 Tax=Vermiconidia calcicola TaxID=1690605 RepID=A0ACC3NZT0_9PEZI|nr:hypothetical protein LTR37_000271 [Vermiconidia calcicola]
MVAQLQSVLAIGLISTPPGSSPRRHRTLPDERKLMSDQRAEARNFGYDLVYHDLRYNELDEKLQLIKAKLQVSKPDLIIIGNGTKGSNEHTAFVEDLVNICRTESPKTKIGFNTNVA